MMEYHAVFCFILRNNNLELKVYVFLIGWIEHPKLQIQGTVTPGKFLRHMPNTSKILSGADPETTEVNVKKSLDQNTLATPSPLQCLSPLQLNEKCQQFFE